MKLIGRIAEQKQIEAFVKNGQHVLLEGPVGVGKTTLAISVSEKLNRKVSRVDGDGRYTEQKLVGSFDPKLVMEQGFVRESFIPGPLYQAMEAGEILLINELNRMPEMVQNVLLPALDEGKIQIPVLGELKAKQGFSVIATQNPREFVATSTLSEALLDRLEWISISALSIDEEVEVVRSQVQGLPENLVRTIVALVRQTRSHPKIKRGASIRAALSLAKAISGQADAQKLTVNDDIFWEISKSALANRIELQTGKFSNRPYTDLMQEVLEELEIELKKKS